MFLSGSAALLGPGSPSFAFLDADGDQVLVRLIGPGSAAVNLQGGQADHADLESLQLTSTTAQTRLEIRVTHSTGTGGTSVGSIVAETLGELRLLGDAPIHDAFIHGNLGRFIASPAADPDRSTTVRLRAGGNIGQVVIAGSLTNSSVVSAGGNIGLLSIAGDLRDSSVLAGASLDESFDLMRGRFFAGRITSALIRGDVADSIVAAGGNPGSDGVFQRDELITGGRIDRLTVTGLVRGSLSAHTNPGIYAAQLGSVSVAGQRLTPDLIAAGAGTTGSAVIDPLPAPANAPTIADIQTILTQAVARARQLQVNATIAILDREGNILAVARMAEAAFPAAATTVDIDASGAGGLEAVDGIVATSLIAATKAGTAAFLSTSLGHAFTTRTAGFIIQSHFPPGVQFQDSGPLFGVQLSSLPTSDVNRLPLGLSADPGGLPLYRGGELIGGIGVEVDGTYTVDPNRIQRQPQATTEELIALAAQTGFQPPKKIRADRVFVDGIRFPYAFAKNPKLAALGPLPAYATLTTSGDLIELVAPRISPASKFASASLARLDGSGTIAGEVPNDTLVDFFDDATSSPAFLDGDFNGTEHLTADDVATILTQAHERNAQLRAQIRKDRPQISQVTVAVVDHNGDLLGVFRTPDAPVFGYDVAAQKARTAAFFSRPDAGAELRSLDAELAADIATAQSLGIIDPTVANPFGRHVDLAQAIGVQLDGTVAVADRTGGFLSRPNLPDGIKDAPPGPFSAQPPDRFSPFNTGLQTTLLIPNLVDFLLAFNAMGEPAGLAAFIAGTLGGPSVVPNQDTAGTGLPGSSLANGLQIFAGSVPLYKDGVLVGGVGVSGDGIEQDDYVAFTGATGFQEFGSGVRRADSVLIVDGIRLPYVKFPRSPFGGL